MARHVQLSLIYADHISAPLAGLQHIARIVLLSTGNTPKAITAGHWWLREHHADPCTCEYWVEGGSWEIGVRRPARRYSPAYASGFRINPACPAHGHLRNAHAQARLHALALRDLARSVSIPREMLEDIPPSAYALVMRDLYGPREDQ